MHPQKSRSPHGEIEIREESVCFSASESVRPGLIYIELINLIIIRIHLTLNKQLK